MNRFSVLINSPARNIWPLLFQGDKWGWFAAVENIRMSGDQVGGVVALFSDASFRHPSWFIRTLKVELHKQYGFAIYSSERFTGFGAFDLKEDGRGKSTQLTYELYLHNFPAPDSNATLEEMHEMTVNAVRRQELDKATKLAALKALVESSGMPGGIG